MKRSNLYKYWKLEKFEIGAVNWIEAYCSVDVGL